MLTTILAAAAPKENPYGLIPALREGGLISQATFGILVLMLFFSLYILFTKLFEQQKILNQGKRMRATFWNANSVREGAAKLEKNSAYRQLADDGIAAQDQHAKLTDPVEAHDWMHGSLRRSEDTINSQLKSGLGFLASVGSTAPFIGRRRGVAVFEVARSFARRPRHHPRAGEDRRGGPGFDRRRRRPGRRGADHDRRRPRRRRAGRARL